MTRKEFIADVAATAAASISGVSEVLRGEEDGELDFSYTATSGTTTAIHILALDVSGYPTENTFMVYSLSDDAPKLVNDVLAHLQDYSAGLRVSQLVSQIASELQKALADGSRNNPFSLDEEEIDEDESDFDEEWVESLTHDHGASSFSMNPEIAMKLNKRIREDLRAVRNARFRVGILRGMKAESHASILSISVRVLRLGLSDQALQAWDLQKYQYVVLLIRYSGTYKSYDAVINEPARSQDIQYRVGVCNRYKPKLSEAIAAFVETTETSDLEDEPQTGAQDSSTGFNSFFISSSMNNFMKEQFTSLLKIRHNMEVGWDGAKEYYNDNQGRVVASNKEPEADGSPLKNYHLDSTIPHNRLPNHITADHLTSAKGDRLSFPLISMQFFIRYLTRCTEFCLICHDQTEDSFEALKPYVCSKPLCLYQYMNLGFGPSVEHEIVTQPFVADLLISFCYASVKGRRLREYPTGMSLSVPPINNVPVAQATIPSYNQSNLALPPSSNSTDGNKGHDGLLSYNVKYDSLRQEIVLYDVNKPCPLRRGDWIVLRTLADNVSTHRRVIDILYPTAKLSSVFVTHSEAPTALAQGNVALNYQPPVVAPIGTSPLNNIFAAEFTIYNQNFDKLEDQHKAETMVMLLDTIPSIREMRLYLKQQKHVSEPSLKTWVDRISPAALGLMRWIIASNRSCIVQVDTCPGQEDSDDIMNKSRLDEKVSNMDGWVQFRFAQGAPDKEHRFHMALEATQGRSNRTYPTLFAWHGSGLQNWHSIIRSGLDFKDTLNGRACGHGCYHSLEYGTSVGYSTNHGVAYIWPGSELKISSAMCLNEIVNAPQEFTCRTPHLVVQHIDWIQCRYLFVRTGGSSQNAVLAAPIADSKLDESTRKVVEIELDKEFTPKGTNGKAIGIPRSTFPVSREFRLKSVGKAWPLVSSHKHYSSKKAEPSSDTEDELDLLFLLSDDEEPLSPPAGKDAAIWKWKGKGKAKRAEDVVMLDSEPRKRAKAETDFIPGSLNQSTLQILEAPAYATTQATQILNRELKAILKVQNTTPLHELGWYINSEMVQNVYQWIIELHSFAPELPLSKDMKSAGIKSVVLEIRFGKDFPVSPPFVRVIRPRFLPFMNGGGGHVTGGGAMCMELLTNSGWSPVSSIESVLLQVRMAIMNLEPKPARLEAQGKQKQRDYSIGEAIDAFVRSCRAHGWQVPKDFKEFASTGNDNYGF